MWLDYNAAKKCVERSAQKEAYYFHLLKVRKWYKKSASEELSRKSFENSLIYFIKYYATQKFSLKQFLESLIFSLLTGKKYVRTQTPTVGIRWDHVLFMY